MDGKLRLEPLAVNNEAEREGEGGGGGVYMRPTLRVVNDMEREEKGRGCGSAW